MAGWSTGSAGISGTANPLADNTPTSRNDLANMSVLKRNAIECMRGINEREDHLSASLTLFSKFDISGSAAITLTASGTGFDWPILDGAKHSWACPELIEQMQDAITDAFASGFGYTDAEDLITKSIGQSAFSSPVNNRGDLHSLIIELRRVIENSKEYTFVSLSGVGAYFPAQSVSESSEAAARATVYSNIQGGTPLGYSTENIVNHAEYNKITEPDRYRVTNVGLRISRAIATIPSAISSHTSYSWKSEISKFVRGATSASVTFNENLVDDGNFKAYVTTEAVPATPTDKFFWEPSSKTEITLLAAPTSFIGALDLVVSLGNPFTAATDNYMKIWFDNDYGTGIWNNLKSPFKELGELGYTEYSSTSSLAEIGWTDDDFVYG